MNSLFILDVAATIKIGLCSYQFIHWRNFKNYYNSRQAFKIVFSNIEITRTYDVGRRRFMRENNRITASIVVITLVGFVCFLLEHYY